MPLVAACGSGIDLSFFRSSSGGSLRLALNLDKDATSHDDLLDASSKLLNILISYMSVE
jgi:hypothetical protein